MGRPAEPNPQRSIGQQTKSVLKYDSVFCPAIEMEIPRLIERASMFSSYRLVNERLKLGEERFPTTIPAEKCLSRLFGHWVCRNVVNGLRNAGNFVSFLVWNFNCKLILNCHDHLHDIQ
jgi:hypothetical protein